MIEVWTDGACKGNPGPGGWSAIVINGSSTDELSGSDPHTTNNRMELMGAIKALESLNEPSEVTIYTDSSYLAKPFTEGWMTTWIRRGWSKKNEPLKNVDLWKRLVDLTGWPGWKKGVHEVTFVQVKGHSGVYMNERCDRLAVAACA